MSRIFGREKANRIIEKLLSGRRNTGRNQNFLSFLGMLRKQYQTRRKRTSFHSVILAGIRDIKNLKLNIAHNEQALYNSPWNIAAEFTVNMSLDEESIRTMLTEYKETNQIDLDASTMAKWIYDYTNGYPYLVSYLCKKMDENSFNHPASAGQKHAWTREDFLEATRILVKGPNTLYDDMIKQITSHSPLYQMLNNILFKGESYPYQAYDEAADIGSMFGFITERNGMVTVANRIFEMQLYSYFVAESLKNDNYF